MNETVSKNYFLKLFVSFLTGSAIFCAFSFIQKIIVGFDTLLLSSYIVAFCFGGLAGTFIGFFFIRSKENGEKLQQLLETLKKNLSDTVNVLAHTIEYRDNYTVGHSRKVSILGCKIAETMKLPESKIEAISLAGLLHDIGKVAVPINILSKSEPLSEKEINIIKQHPITGYELIKDIDFPFPIARIVLEHHERLDGSGYPNGKKGEELLFESKIIAVADVVEAITFSRPYRGKAPGIDKAFEEITKNSGILYDKEVVDACIKLFKEENYKLEELKNNFEIRNID